MNFNEYQSAAEETAIYPEYVRKIYPTLGLCGEAGEVAEKVKKLYRDGGGREHPAFLSDLKKEIGDVLWYVAAICRDFGISMDRCAELNIAKLQSRKARGVLQGSGDNR